jgi:hypothetical protein
MDYNVNLLARSEARECRFHGGHEAEAVRLRADDLREEAFDRL